MFTRERNKGERKSKKITMKKTNRRCQHMKKASNEIEIERVMEVQ